MLDMALLCISTMTNDKPFYEINREKLIKAMCNFKYQIREKHKILLYIYIMCYNRDNKSK